jgi:uroporphyrinogen decarboxylase
MSYRTKRTPDFSRLRKVLLCEGEPDIVPNIELGVHPVWKAKQLGRPCLTVADEVEFARQAGYDYVKLQPGIDMNPAGIFPTGGAKIVDLPSQAGQRRWADEHHGVIGSIEDFDRYTWPKKEDVSYARLEDAASAATDGMGVIGQYGDIYTLIWGQMGFETFCMALYEQPELIQRLFDTVGGIVYNLFENMASMEHVKALWYSDDLAYVSGLMISPDFFREYLFPWVRKIGDLCKARDIPFLYHTDGLLWDVLDDLVDCGVTSLHPIEPKAMDILEVKQRYAGKLAVLGNIDVDLLSRGTPEEVDREVMARMALVKPGGGWALGSSNSVPDYADFNNYLTMLAAGDKYGAY